MAQNIDQATVDMCPQIRRKWGVFLFPSLFLIRLFHRSLQSSANIFTNLTPQIKYDSSSGDGGGCRTHKAEIILSENWLLRVIHQQVEIYSMKRDIVWYKVTIKKTQAFKKKKSFHLPKKDGNATSTQGVTVN